MESQIHPMIHNLECGYIEANTNKDKQSKVDIDEKKIDFIFSHQR